MGFRFRKSFKVASGVRLNISKKGVSTTIGPHGAKLTVRSNGTRFTTNIPGTGISYSKKLDSKQASQNIEPTNNKQTNIVAEKLTAFGDAHKAEHKKHLANIKQDTFYKEDMFILTMFILFYPLGIFLMYNYSLKLRKYRFIINILPLITVAIIDKMPATLLGIIYPLFFVPILTLIFFYRLYKTKYFMPCVASIVISCFCLFIYGARFF